jgi:hypothetical protein
VEDDSIGSFEGEFEEVANVPGDPLSFAVIVRCDHYSLCLSNLFSHSLDRSCLFLAHIEFQTVPVLHIDGTQPIQLAEVATTGDAAGAGKVGLN